ncbi:hypothetical protein M2413_003225 [Pseudomonas putida]|nr:hypothetical protein [Pseudomonas putida]
MTDPLDLSVLIPARNEVENLPSLLMEIRAALAAKPMKYWWSMTAAAIVP